MHLQYILGFLHCVPSPILARIDRKRHWSSADASRQALLVSVTYIRSLFYPDLHSLDPNQLDVWRRSLHRHRTGLCYHTAVILHLILSIRRSQHLYGYADTDYLTLRHYDDLDAPSSLLLVLRSRIMRRAFRLQPASILIRRLYHRLQGIPSVDVSG